MLLPILLLFCICAIIMVCSFQIEKFISKPKIVLDKIYYINLDRRPDRKQHILKQIYTENIPYDKVQRFRAIDGKFHQFTKEELDMFKNFSLNGSDNAKLIMGNQLSHYYILKEMVKKKYKYILVLQDDVVFKKEFNRHLDNVLSNLPADAEMVNIGFHKYAVNEHFEPMELEDPMLNKVKCKKEENKFVCHWNNHMNPCSLAYIVTLNGAQNMIEYFQKTGFRDATDWNFNKYLRSKNIFYGSKIVLCTGALMGSNIFGPSAL